MKMTYTEQLAHPNWQRKRLAMLESAGWKCSQCNGGEKQLHVHHKQYFKGRMAWEYEDSELDVLCADCHKDEHEVEELMKQLLVLRAENGETMLRAGVAMIAGFMSASSWFEDSLQLHAIRDKCREQHPSAFEVGVAAFLVAIGSRAELANALSKSANFPMSAAVTEMLDRWGK